MTFYVENPNDSTKKVLELFSFSKFARYKINIQKSLVFLNTNNELKSEIKEICVHRYTHINYMWYVFIYLFIY